MENGVNAAEEVDVRSLAEAQGFLLHTRCTVAGRPTPGIFLYSCREAPNTSSPQLRLEVRARRPWQFPDPRAFPATPHRHATIRAQRRRSTRRSLGTLRSKLFRHAMIRRPRDGLDGDVPTPTGASCTVPTARPGKPSLSSPARSTPRAIVDRPRVRTSIRRFDRRSILGRNQQRETSREPASLPALLLDPLDAKPLTRRWSLSTPLSSPSR